jgi:hypothetical protein
MEIDEQKLIENAIRDGIREGVKQKLSASYNNPFDKMIGDSLGAAGGEFRALLSESLASCLSDSEFREEIKKSTRLVLAKVLVQRFGGELEKQVNALKSDPATRARITVAIDEIVRQKAEA